MHNVLLSPVLERAFRVAALYHQSQTRKGSDLPYIVHPCAVMSILQSAGIQDGEILAAALLHDVVEDTECELSDLQGQFPSSVVRWVDQTSEEKEDEQGEPRSWVTRKREHLKHADHADWQARSIILADKLHNLTSMLFDLEEGENIWERFNAPASSVLWYNSSMIQAAGHGDEPALQLLKSSGEELIDQLIEQSGQTPIEPEES